MPRGPFVLTQFIRFQNMVFISSVTEQGSKTRVDNQKTWQFFGG